MYSKIASVIPDDHVATTLKTATTVNQFSPDRAIGFDPLRSTSCSHRPSIRLDIEKAAIGPNMAAANEQPFFDSRCLALCA
jgi:hypothetical protein